MTLMARTSAGGTRSLSQAFSTSGWSATSFLNRDPGQGSRTQDLKPQLTRIRPGESRFRKEVADHPEVLNGSPGERVPKILICADGGPPDLACAAVQIDRLCPPLTSQATLTAKYRTAALRAVSLEPYDRGSAG